MPPKKPTTSRGARTGGAKTKKSSTATAPRTQRKIVHLLDSSGTGDTFRYYNKLNRKAQFLEGDSVYLTEKWDGTTAQATNAGVYKRLDLLKKGDPRKATASESERYMLEKLDLEHNKNRWIREAVQEYTSVFQSLPDGVCVYFEAIGTSIGGRFKHLDEFHDIRVFDFARDDKYLSFDDTVALATEYSLPLVHYDELTDLTVAGVIEQLSRTSRSYTDIDAELEGFVVRDITDRGRVAKIRVEDLANVHEAHY
jgi:hypothetical protein